MDPLENGGCLELHGGCTQPFSNGGFIAVPHIPVWNRGCIQFLWKIFFFEFNEMWRLTEKWYVHQLSTPMKEQVVTFKQFLIGTAWNVLIYTEMSCLAASNPWGWGSIPKNYCFLGIEGNIQLCTEAIFHNPAHHGVEVEVGVRVNLWIFFGLEFNEMSCSTKKCHVWQPTSHVVGDSGCWSIPKKIFLLEIERNVQPCTVKSSFITMQSIGRDGGVGVNLQFFCLEFNKICSQGMFKNSFGTNCMKCSGLHRKVMLANHHPHSVVNSRKKIVARNWKKCPHLCREVTCNNPTPMEWSPNGSQFPKEFNVMSRCIEMCHLHQPSTPIAFKKSTYKEFFALNLIKCIHL